MLIYMDQFAWVKLTQQRAASEDGGKEWQRLLSLQEQGDVVFVLSAANYLETWHRRDPKSRHALARTMRDLTDYRCIYPVQKIVDFEIEYCLLRNCRSATCNCPATEPATRVFGRGVAHAFDSPTGRLRLVERIHLTDAAEGPPASGDAVEEIIQLIAEMPTDVYEWWSIAAPAEDTANLGMEFRGEHRFGSEYVARQEAKSAWFDANPTEFRRVDDYVVAEIALGLVETRNAIADQHFMDAAKISQWQINVGSGNALNWINELPSAHCQARLIAAKMRNRQWRWQQHDYTDIGAISGALPYVDVLVTEKAWTHVARAAKLDKKYGTQVVSNIAELMKILRG